MIRHLVNLLLWVLPPSRFFGLRRAALRAAGLELGQDVSYCGRGWVYGRGRVIIGDKTWLSPGVVIHSNPNAPITIGARCDLGPGVEFVPGTHAIGGSNRRAGAGSAAPISVGDGCWLGARVLVLGGVSIGEGCIVAAGAVVTRSVPPHTLVAGVPAVARRELAR